MEGSEKGKRKLRKAAMEHPEPEPEPEAKDTEKVSAMHKIAKIKKRRRFGMPGSFICEGCSSVLSKGLKVNAVKETVGELRKYKILCPCCGRKIALERTVGDGYRIIEGVLIDWAGFRKECSKRFFDSVAPDSTGRDLDVFDTFNIALMVQDTTNGQCRAI